MPSDSRRRFLRRTGSVLGVAALFSAAGCTGSDDAQTAPSPEDSPTADSGGTATPTRTSPSSDPSETDSSTPGADIQPIDGAWHSYRRDAHNTAAIDDPGPREEPSELWRRATETGAHPATDPAAGDDAFYVGMENGRIYAFEAATGEIRWRSDRSVDAAVGPVASGDTVVATSGDSLVGLAADSGKRRWSVPLEGAVDGGLAIDSDFVIAATEAGVSAVSVADEKRLWHVPLDAAAKTQPAIGDGAVAVGTDSGVFVTLDAESGDERWRESAQVESGLGPAVRDGRVFVATPDRLAAYDAADGTERWTDSPGPTVVSPPVATDGRLLLGILDDRSASRPTAGGDTEHTLTPYPTDTIGYRSIVIAYDPADGTEQWTSDRSGTYNFTSGPPGLSLSATDDRVFVVGDRRLRALDSGSGETDWTARDAGWATPVVADGVVSTGAVGFALADGSEQWRFEVGDRIESAPAVVGNTVYVGSDDNHLYALAANAGTVEWRARTGGQVRSSPAVAEESVYIGSEDGFLYSFDRDDGSQQWRYDTGGRIESSPAVADGTVYVGSESGLLVAVDAARGSRRWEEDFGDYFLGGSPAVADGVVYAGANEQLRALDVEDGSERWSVDFPGSRILQAVPTVADGRVFVRPAETLYALDATDGSELWTRETGGAVVNTVAVRDGTVYAPGDRNVYAFDAESGTEQWRTETGYGLWAIAGEETVYASGSDGSVVALDAEDGEELWRRRGVESWPSAGIGEEYLFVGDSRGRVRAFGPEP